MSTCSTKHVEQLISGLAWLRFRKHCSKHEKAEFWYITNLIFATSVNNITHLF